MSNIVDPAVQRNNLCEGAAVCLKAMGLGLDLANEEIVANCISRYSYSSVHGFCDWLNWVVYRVSNAFAALIGKQTDWDMAKKIVLDRDLDLAVRLEILEADPILDISRTHKERSISYLSSCGEKLLDRCLKAQDDQVLASEDNLPKDLKELSHVARMKKVYLLGYEVIKEMIPN